MRTELLLFRAQALLCGMVLLLLALLSQLLESVGPPRMLGLCTLFTCPEPFVELLLLCRRRPTLRLLLRL